MHGSCALDGVTGGVNYCWSRIRWTHEIPNMMS